MRQRRSRLETLEDAIEAIHDIENTAHEYQRRITGWEEEKFQGGLLGELRRELAAIKDSAAELGAQLPDMINFAVSRRQTETDASAFRKLRAWIAWGVVAPVVVGVVVFLATHH